MQLDTQTLQSIAERYGVKHLGYYVMLYLFGPLNPSKMADKCKISQGQCRKIEQDLASIGLLTVSGVGRGRTVEIICPKVDEEAREVLAYFASKMSKNINASDEWYQRQYKAAQDLVNEFGREACLFMIDYLAVKDEDVYSLNFVKTVAPQLMPKYKLYQEARASNKASQDVWANLPQKTFAKQVKETVSTSDIEDIFDFGIEI